MKDYIKMTTESAVDLFSKGCEVNLNGSELILIFRSIQYFLEDAPQTKKGRELKAQLLTIVDALEEKVMSALKGTKNTSEEKNV